ncbi:SAM-dependent methyltransferase [Prauserella marina]|uniref:S-adenosyl methyltransferase n=1 Tax=Prauserella marina TaxID=530584 RepID=A0A222VTT8_9PSEU|nr:SAM-dependent methyltransferase [Prauserella marina]ASR37290.1 SAM-dependent methyltransferase [Prauserella marina]PWV72628.1 S-adenosyl methyltransferase [Prauserella marina]SDD75662.1 S-adenosyl methyltransferase [Prauserella marina]
MSTDHTTPSESEVVVLDDGLPTAARVYDVMLNGKDNYAIDRQVAEASLGVMPELKEIALHNRALLHRVVRFLAKDKGITQFLDLGSGLPTARNTHEVAQEANPEAKVVYVDIDPIVLAHGRAILADNPNTKVVTADIRNPAEVLAHPDLRELLDFDQPVCVMLCGILHHLMDEEDPKGLVSALLDAVPSGSYFFITNFTRLSDSPESEELERVLLSQLGTGRVRTPAELAEFFDGMEILPPGIVPLPLWRPDELVTDATTIGVRFMTGGVGRKN